jgi:glycosyltransferase involved in cell wall biosynthesis
MPRKTLSCCIVVRNEQKKIKQCLDGIDILADEIIIVDTGSTDKTCDIIAYWVRKRKAQKNVKLFRVEKQFHDDDDDFNFGAAKTFGFSKATKDFVMWLDASDKVRKQKEIKKAFIEETRKDPNIYFALPSALTNTYAFSRIRIGPRANASMEGMIHEQMKFNVKLKRVFLPVPIVNIKSSRDLDRNMRTLKKEWKRKKSARICFYIANTYKEQRNTTEALKWFRKRAYDHEFKNVFDEEHFKTLECIAEIVLHVKKSNTITMSDLNDVSREMIDMEPTRVEGHYYLAQYYMSTDEWKKAMDELRSFRKCKKPTQYKLWLNKHIYKGKAIINAFEKCQTALKYDKVLVPESITNYNTGSPHRSTYKRGNTQY